MLLFEGTSPLDQAWNWESPRSQPRHGGFCSHRNPDKVSSSDRFFSVQIPTLHRLERGALPDRFANFFQSVVFTNGGMRYHLINFRLAQVKFSIFNLRYLINFRLTQVNVSFHCYPIPHFFIPDSPEITLGESFGRIWIKVNVETLLVSIFAIFPVEHCRNLSIFVLWYPIMNVFAYSEI